MINEILDNITSRFADSVSWVYEYVLVTEVVGGAVVVLILLGLLGRFAPFDWAKKLFGWIGSMVIAAAAAAVFMWRVMRAANQADRDKIRKLQAGQREKSGGGWFGN